MSEAPERFTTYNVMMSAESGREIPSPNGKWVRYEDHKAAVAAAYEDAAKLVETIGIPRDEFDAHNGNPRPSLAQAIRARGDTVEASASHTNALAERDARVRAEALREAAKIAFSCDNEIEAHDDIFALIPDDKEKDNND